MAFEVRSRKAGDSGRRLAGRSIVSVASLGLLLGGCFHGTGVVTPAPVVCGTMATTVRGQMGSYGVPINTSGTAVADGTTVTVTTTGSGTVIDGQTATGTPTITGTTQTFKSTVQTSEHIITYTGTITGPPTPCTGRGAWTVKLRETGQVIGRGNWTIP